MNDADGFALLAWFTVGGLVLVFAAMAVEAVMAREMRRRARQRDVYRRYCELIDGGER